jgi:SAM-dependent methyltransferase
MDQVEVDARIRAYYTSAFDESARLTARSPQGRLEFERAQELVTTRLDAGSHVIDVGGATGIHAAALAAAGHDVTMVDPVPAQVAAAQAIGTFEAICGDARVLDFPANSFDAALLFGPLYHLADRRDRARALHEAARVVRPGGWVFAAVIPRYVAHASLVLGHEVPHPYPDAWIGLLEHGSFPLQAEGFPGVHFHTSEELEEELTDAGLTDVEVLGIEGPTGLAFEMLVEADDRLHDAAMTIARATAAVPGVRDTSSHVMGIARVPAAGVRSR